MCCTARIIRQGITMAVGQPEPNRGIVPGAGATQRLPRIVGLEQAAMMLRTGRPLSGKEAVACGLIREEVEGDVVPAAVALARAAARGEVTLTAIDPRPPDTPVSLPPVELGHLSRTIDALICRAMLEGCRKPLYEGLRFESEMFGACCATEDIRIGVQNFIANGPRAKAEVIGQETYGKGSVQNLYPLDRYAIGQDPGYGQLTVTIGMYYRVTGDSTQNRGVQPDVRLPSAIDTEEVAESSRDAARPWNRIRSAPFKRETTLAPVISDLQRLHAQRVTGDPDYQHMLAEISTLEDMRKRKAVSLNLEKRRTERTALTHGELARENDRRAALGEESLDDAEDIKDLPDAILTEASQITAELAQLEAGYAHLDRGGHYLPPRAHHRRISSIRADKHQGGPDNEID